MTVSIEGCLDPSTNSLHFEKIEKYIVESKIRFVGASFRNSLNFEKFQFEGNIEFRDCIFNDKISFKSAIFSEDLLFSGCIFRDVVNFEGTNFRKNASFQKTQFIGDVIFAKSEFSELADFSKCQFESSADFFKTNFKNTTKFIKTLFRSLASFENSRFKRETDFHDAIFARANLKEIIFEGLVNFENAKFLNDAEITNSIFKSIANFRRTTFENSAEFSQTSFENNANFDNAIIFGDLSFNEAEFWAKANFNKIKLNGEKIIFSSTCFNDASSQEYICRLISKIMASKGDKIEQDNYYFLEMEAKRRRKGIEHQKRWSIDLIRRFILYDFLEYIFIQCIFGYGVRPKRLIVFWLFFITIFGLIYSFGEGIRRIDDFNTTSLDYFYFSLMNAATPGYSPYETVSWVFTLIAGIEALIGTFIWATFIATFARKFMR